ncbi:MAG: hypothetical protein U9R49_09180 [Bacteroidota bacterium]|nr:hypothetical protein [Bacteroidota bacterium]
MRIKNSIQFVKVQFITALFLLLLMPAKGQLISVQSLVSSDSLMIGEQITYTLKVDADSEIEFMLPLIRDTLSSHLEVLTPLSSDTLVEGNRTVVEQSYMITGFESGSQILPSQEVIYRRAGGIDTARSMPLIIKVYDPVVDTTQQIKPIKPPINTPVTFRELLPWLAAGLGGLLILGTVIWLVLRYLRRKKNPEKYSNKPLEPAHVIAFRELDKLKEGKIWTRGEVKEYYTRLTEITRHYIERQYDIPAMESTTEEILHAFQRANPEDHLLDEILKELLELADLVKFAREDPLPLDNQTNLNNAYIFVQKTYPLFYRSEEKMEAVDE